MLLRPKSLPSWAYRSTRPSSPSPESYGGYVKRRKGCSIDGSVLLWYGKLLVGRIGNPSYGQMRSLPKIPAIFLTGSAAQRHFLMTGRESHQRSCHERRAAVSSSQ